jgi:hypothetical protein
MVSDAAADQVQQVIKNVATMVNKLQLTKWQLHQLQGFVLFELAIGL